MLKGLQPPERRSVLDNIRRGNPVYDIALGALDSTPAGEGEKLKRLADLGEIIWVFPAGAGGASNTRVIYTLTGNHHVFEDMIREVGATARRLLSQERKSGQSTSGATDKPDAVPAGRADTAIDNGRRESSRLAVKVDIEILDSMMNTVSELYSVRVGLVGVANRLPRTDRTRRLRDDLLKLGLTLDKRISDLEGTITSVRLTPISMLFERYRGEVRRLARHRGKKLKLSFEGESTQVDRALLRRLHDPLLHLIRNAVDHGIEPAEERTKSGKDAEGTILVRARQEANHIRVDIEDDGRGIDEEKIMAAASAKGITIEDGEAPAALLFKAGLSTKENVDEISGRGVGLDAAKTQIEAMRGMITVDSTSERGTRFSIWVPLTLAVSRGILVRESKVPAVIPLGSVVEVLRLTHARREEMDQKGTLKYKGVETSVAVLSHMLGIEKPVGAGFIVIVGVGENRRAIQVEGVGGETDIVSRPLPAVIAPPRFLTGAAEMDDGTAAIIIQPEEILRETKDGTGGKTDTVDEALSEASRFTDEWRHERMLKVLVFRRGDDLYGVPLGFLSEVIPARRPTRVPVLGRQWQGLFFARGMCHGLIAIPGSGADESDDTPMMIVLQFPERCGIGATEVLGHFVLPHQKLEPDRSGAGAGDLATFGVFEWEGRRVKVLDIPETLRRTRPAGTDGTSNERQASSGTEPLMQTRIVDDR